MASGQAGLQRCRLASPGPPGWTPSMGPWRHMLMAPSSGELKGLLRSSQCCFSARRLEGLPVQAVSVGGRQLQRLSGNTVNVYTGTEQEAAGSSLEPSEKLRPRVFRWEKHEDCKV
ncbi:uncharacterized protein [Manis javanica]|uniref:uncharacterized protein isoform X2 n=1 Tax=Manis javanica TaxID=9974 RepID=UPI003C6D6640